MKGYFFVKLILGICVAVTLCMSANADFEKVNTYKSGMFEDVPKNAWYASEVKSAYELGFMNGTSDSTMSPDGSMTVAQGITVASRVHAIFNNKRIEESAGGKWYDMYVSYAEKNGICKKNDFNSLDRNIRRYEMAVLFANALPESHFAPKNDIKAIPDVNEKENYADKLLMLYKAGVVLGSDEYGTFYPNNPIKRSEAAAIINRAAIVQNRVSGTLTALPEYKEAYYLIDNTQMYFVRSNKQNLASGWVYDNRCNMNVDTTGVANHNLDDASRKGYVAINRRFEPQSKGVVTFRANALFVNAENGARIYFENTKDKNVFEIYSKNGTFSVKTVTGDVDTGVAVETRREMNIRVDFDLDEKLAVVYIDEAKAAERSLGDFSDLARIFYSTSNEDILTLTPVSTQLYANYAVNEPFTNENTPSDWRGDFTTERLVDTRDNYSIALTKDEKAKKSFEKIGGKVVFESYFYMPENEDSLYISLDNGEKMVVKVDVTGSVISGGNVQHTFKNNIWQCIYIEADTAEGIAKLYINGKHKGEIPFTADGFDGITLACREKKGKRAVYFDDVKVYNIYDYPDYCPAPNKAQSDDYVLIMSVCSLWREGTHYGWDYVSPYDECSPLLGYYDEGIPETSDWEIKIMAEHGIDAMQYCWYTAGTAFDAPIKHPRLDYGLHDGYFHAKYSDEVDFCILFENQNFKNGAKLTLDDFKNYIWDYWVEWYFRDDRYLKVDNKAVLQWFRSDLIYTMFENPKAVVDFMKEDIKNYGYDGLILLAQGNGAPESISQKYARTGFDGIGSYGWDANSSRPEYMRSVNGTALKVTQKMPGFSYLPCVATGRNIIGWDNVRTDMATVEQHAELLGDYKEILRQQKEVKGEGWMSKMLYFSTWNEYGEGHWLAPSGLNGFGYADQWRKAFTDAPEVHDDILPTINQKNRICRLYNDSRQPIRPWLEVEIPPQDNNEVVIREFTFKNPSDITGWSDSRVDISSNEGVMHVVGNGSNPILRSPYDQKLNASDVKKIHVRARVSVAGKVDCFFVTESDLSETASKGMSTIVSKENEYVDIYFDTTACSAWSGIIHMIRFDLIDVEGSFDVEFIRLLGAADVDNAEYEKNAVKVDGVVLDIPDYYRTVEGDEQYIALDPSTGIFSAANMYHEWNRFEGTLYIKTHNDTEFLFTVGSKTVIVNGKEKALEKAFYTYDHVPVVPLKFMLQQAGIEYTLSGEKGIDISVRGYNHREIEENRKLNEFEFDIRGDYEGWKVRNAVSYFDEGTVVLVPTATESKVKYDPFMVKSVYNFLAEDYNTLTVRMKYELANDKDEMIVFYFATSAEPVLSETKTVRSSLSKGDADGDGYYLYTFNLSSNGKWKSSVTQVRFDLPSAEGVFTIDNIKFSKN